MIDKLNIYADEIIAMCNDIIKLNHSPNIVVVKGIKREFESIQHTIIKDKKVLVLTKAKDIWSSKLIIDSAYLEYDSNLFDKVFAFEKLCKKLLRTQIKTQY